MSGSTRLRRAGALRLGSPGVRLRVGLAAVLAVLAVLGLRLVQLQGVSAAGYAADADSQRTRTQVLPAVRGAILDRNGQALALSSETSLVFGEPRVLAAGVCRPKRTKPCTADEVAAAVAPEIKMPVDQVRARLADTSRGYVVLAQELDPEVGLRVRALKLPGIGVQGQPRRLHPGHDLAANVIGFTTHDGRGAAGIEQTYQSVLGGKDGSVTSQIDSKGRVIPTAAQERAEPVAGHDVQLTLDRDLQFRAQQLIAAKVAETKAQSGSVVVMDVHTGQVLAMATAPTFDADNINGTDATQRGNPPVGEIYDPGSVNKVIMAAAAIESGVVTPDTVIDVPYSKRFGDHLVKDAEGHPEERMTFNGIIIKSSNVGTVTVAEKLGPERVTKALRDFGFGRVTGIGLPGEQPGLVINADKWTGSSLGTIPIGQGVSITALQAASVYQTVANNGVRVTPSIVQDTVDDSGRTVPMPAPESHRVVSEATAQALRPMLEGVVSDQGTAARAEIAGYRVAGKTGTADFYNDQLPHANGSGKGGYESGKYTSSFIGFAPADAPRLVTAVVLQRTGENGYFGGLVAAPVFHDVMSFALGADRVPPTGTTYVQPLIYPDKPR